MDCVDAVTRSRMMSGIRGMHTRPEKMIRTKLHGRGFRFRLHDKKLPGKPDLVLRRYGAVIFVHGCFWHRHGCALFRWPATRVEFWRNKIDGNCVRDQRHQTALRAQGWRIAIVWECALRGRQARCHLDEVIDRLAAWLHSAVPVIEIC